jgi:hypothetical protein
MILTVANTHEQWRNLRCCYTDCYTWEEGLLFGGSVRSPCNLKHAAARRDRPLLVSIDDAARGAVRTAPPRGSIGRCNAFSEGSQRWGSDRILLLVFASWRRCMRVEVSNPTPAVWGSIPGLGICGYARPFRPCAAKDLTPKRPKPTWAALRPRLRFRRRRSSPVWVMVAITCGSESRSKTSSGLTMSRAVRCRRLVRLLVSPDQRATGGSRPKFIALRDCGMSRAAPVSVVQATT